LAIENDPEIATRIDAYEMAFRLQTSAPELMDLKSERPETLKLYGVDPQKPSFARACLLARRMIERGVRCVNIIHSGWDAHSNVAGNVTNNARATDQGSAALITDLKQRGLLEDTLVIWGGEFGRTPMAQGSGRDHHIRGFSMWMAGGGIRKGYVHGETDDFCYNIVRDPVHINDLNATVLQCLGLDHERFTYRYQGLDQRLTSVQGARVVNELLA
jgi:uncharacterized protein (DUF1501 family)